MENIGSMPEVQAHEVSIEPAWLNTRQAETYSGLSRVTLWKLRAAGEIRAARVGRAVRINRKSLDDYLNRCADNA